jgi:hypothetical protein
MSLFAVFGAVAELETPDCRTSPYGLRNATMRGRQPLQFGHGIVKLTALFNDPANPE